ncbi:VgrG-related protein [Streptomyces kronopolitis]|uniref:VgrG-related protein n=1 Tax=Streptomyces kronopolitis TaxID=1612435 RepID=UPI0036954E80
MSAPLVVQIGGKPLPHDSDSELSWATVEESGCTSSMAEVGFHDPSHSLTAKTGFKLKADLKLVARDQRGDIELFSGQITGWERRTGETGTFSVFVVEDLANLLKKRRKMARYQQMSADEIAAKLARDAGLKVGTLDSTSLVYESISQPLVSDWDFLTHLARENGCDVFVSGGALHFRSLAEASKAPSMETRAEQSPFVLEYGKNLTRVRTGASLRDQATSVEVRGWDPERKQKLVAQRTVDSTPSRDVSWKAAAVRGEPLLLPFVPRASQNEVETVAASMAHEIAGALTELHTVVKGEPRIRLRSAVTLRGLGDQFDGRYTVTSVRHQFHPATGYQTEVMVCEGTDRAVVGGPGNAEDGLRRMPGLMIAEVVDIKDPKDQGRIKLRFPSLSDDYVSDWARTVQLGGSKGGGIVVPEVGDEVLVGFQQGSLDYPYVIGGLYNGVDKPSPHEVALYDDSKGTTNRRSFVSKKGHRLELLDSDQGPLGVLLATGDNKFRIDLDQHATRVAINSDGTVSIEAKQNLQVKGNGITVDAGTGTLKLSGSKVEVSGTSVEVSGSGDVKVKGGALAEISAAMVKLN